MNDTQIRQHIETTKRIKYGNFKNTLWISVRTIKIT